MANSMYYWVKVQKKNGEILDMYRNVLRATPTSTHACWADLGEWGAARDRVLKEIYWFVELASEGSQIRSKEEFTMLMDVIFPKDDVYSMKWEFTGEEFNFHNSDAYPKWPEVRIYDFDDYPRQLFMNKLFTIRNLSRYPREWRNLMDKGWPLELAVTVGANLTKVVSFTQRAGVDTYRIPHYASTFQPDGRGAEPLTIADIRNAAYCTRYRGNLGDPWSRGGGYLSGTRVMGSIVHVGYSNSKAWPFRHDANLTEDDINDMLKLLKGKGFPKKS